MSAPLGGTKGTFGSEHKVFECPTQRDDGAPREALLPSGRLRLPVENNALSAASHLVVLRKTLIFNWISKIPDR